MASQHPALASQPQRPSSASTAAAFPRTDGPSTTFRAIVSDPPPVTAVNPSVSGPVVWAEKVRRVEYLAEGEVMIEELARDWAPALAERPPVAVQRDVAVAPRAPASCEILQEFDRRIGPVCTRVSGP